MAYDGMGAFVDALERRGELVRVRAPVRARLEVAEIADRTMKSGGPALLFERVDDSPFPLLINAFGSRARMSLALGVSDLEEHARRIAELVHTQAPADARALARLATALPELSQVPPRKHAGSAPCQEVVLRGDEVDLDRLPILTTWPQDGGPFITLPNVITRDPDTGARNVGMYRMQKLDRRSTAMHWQIHKTGARHFRRAKELGKRLEVAVALGGDPALTYAATAPLPDGVDEWMFAGFLRRKAVRTTRAKTVDLDVPADADFVIEGYVDPAEPLVDEGPFGDHTGYYTPVDRFPRFHVTAITHRRSAVYPCTLVGPPPMEDAWLGKATERLFLPLLKMMFPEVVDMNLPVEGAFHNLVILSIKKQYPFHASRVAHGLWGAGQMMFSKAILVVDDDVDVQNLRDVTWRLLANLDPKRDVSFVDGPIDQLDHGANQALWGGKMCIDGTRKWKEEGYAREWPEVCRMSPEVKSRVDEIWPTLGIPSPSAMTSTRAVATPYAADSSRVRTMFDRIAGTYDTVNRAMTAGVDVRWRKKAVAALEGAAPGDALDLCAGTMDLAALLAKKNGSRVVAADFSAAMLALGREKVPGVETVVADALALPFEDGAFSKVICGFGMRNLADVERGVREVRRVLKPGGVFVTLELFRPKGKVSRAFHDVYSKHVLPAIGGALSGDRAAYDYLVRSIEGFVTRDAYEELLRDAGFSHVKSTPLAFGVGAIVRAEVGLA
jgi:4-hydroxy-3-polyprenylbenzoate decarboxylase